MIRHALTLIFRNARRFGLSLLINVIGLSTGLAAAVLIYLWIADELRSTGFI